VHLVRADVPMALAELHRATTVGGPVHLVFFRGDEEHAPAPDEDFDLDRRFNGWPPALLAAVLEGAGFVVHDEDRAGLLAADARGVDLHVRAMRRRSLADTVGPQMRVLVCGLNPSLYAADAGVGFARPGNRFWPAALGAGLVSRDRDPVHALRQHGVGMTDLVKRATARADELTAAEYRHGLGRLDQLCSWLQPAAVCFVGLAGWRAAVDRHAIAGLQAHRVGGRPVYVMPSTSGANAHVALDELVEHLRLAVQSAPVGPLPKSPTPGVRPSYEHSASNDSA
jgi:TDG/mug DNA glycosylase family protein